LTSLHPTAHTGELLAELVPPREFSLASFDNYVPDKAFISQSEALASAKAFAKTVGARKVVTPGIYLDGGFGVGKTHLLAAVYHAARGQKLFGSFLSYTALIGALGFAKTIDSLKNYDLIAIDEFELDDPGNTMLMSRFLNDLSACGVRFASTSNTPPNALGQGRFAAADFQREILGIGRNFNMIRIDGNDYRHRPVEEAHQVFTVDQLRIWVGAKGSLDTFSELLEHLSRIHPSLYSKLIESTTRIALTDASVLKSQDAALRFVTFVDRAYELQVPIRSSGVALTQIFPGEYLSGAYTKKYYRAISRLGALCNLQTN
jgi:cell division protein ZapE